MAGERDQPQPNDYQRRVAADLHLQSIEARLDDTARRVRRLEEWRLGASAMLDALPEIRSKVEQQERTDAIERGVSEGLRKAEVRGWGSTERRLAILGGAGIIISLGLNAFQTFFQH